MREKDEYVSDFLLTRISLLVRGLILINLFSIWLGFYIYYDQLDMTLNTKIAYVGLLSQEGTRTSKFFLLFGQIFFILFSLFGLYLYRGGQLWKWTGIFFGILLCVSAVTTLKYTLSTGVEACGTRCVSGMVLYLVQNAASVALFGLSLWRLRIAHGWILALGGWMFQIVFPFVFSRSKFGGKFTLIAGLLFLVLGVVLGMKSFRKERAALDNSA